jgi:putative transposase
MWLIDFTRVGGLLRSVWVGAVIDAFSRRVLAIGVAPLGPAALSAVRLLRLALRDAGAPRWLVSDHGPEFTSRVVSRFLTRRGIRRRFGAIGTTGSLALLERFWGSMKREYARGILLFRPHRTIERQLRAYAQWANAERPHQGLGQRTPDDVFYGRAPTPPRRVEAGTLSVDLIDGDHELPVLRFRAAA